MGRVDIDGPERELRQMGGWVFAAYWTMPLLMKPVQRTYCLKPQTELTEPRLHMNRQPLAHVKTETIANPSALRCCLRVGQRKVIHLTLQRHSLPWPGGQRPMIADQWAPPESHMNTAPVFSARTDTGKLQNKRERDDKAEGMREIGCNCEKC